MKHIMNEYTGDAVNRKAYIINIIYIFDFYY